jgi:peptide/nickel transport system permease protein
VSFIYRRIAFYLVALWSALTLNFLLPRLMPGHPIDSFYTKYRTEIMHNPHFLDQLRIELGVPKSPLYVQYFQYLGNLFHGNLGISYSYYPTPVIDVIRTTLPWTLLLAGSATVLAFTIGTFLGIIVAWRRGGIFDSILPPVTMFASAFPAFFLALLLLYFLAFLHGWFPLEHSYSGDTNIGWNWAFIKDAADHALLPVIVVVSTGIGGWLLGMRNVMINTLADDFIAMAHAKGLSDFRVMMMYAARNAILPNLTGFAIALGYTVGGLTLVETVFSYPGVGFTLVNAALGSDYPLVQALLMLIVVAVLLANLAMDLVYARLDPRARAQ